MNAFNKGMKYEGEEEEEEAMEGFLCCCLVLFGHKTENLHIQCVL